MFSMCYSSDIDNAPENAMLGTVAFLLIVAGQQGPGVAMASFQTKAECQAVADDIQQQTKDKPRIGFLYGICVKYNPSRTTKLLG